MQHLGQGNPQLGGSIINGMITQQSFQISFNEIFHALEEPTSLNTLELLPRLKQIGVAALKIEGRQRGVAYVSSVTRTWRKAIDQVIADAGSWQLKPEWQAELSRHAEGHQTTLGPYHRAWH